MSAVSVIIPTYNCSRFIGAALDSVLNQTLPPDEIIVVDDASTDNTAEVLAAYGDRITCVTALDTGGYASAVRNVGIKAAAGDYIAFLDADDIWFPTKLAEQIKVLNAHPEVQMVYSNYNRIDEDDNIIESQSNRPWAIEKGSIVQTDSYWPDAFCQLAVRCFMQTSTVIVRKSAFDEVGFFDSNMLFYEDADLWMRITHSHQVKRVAHVLASYRKRGGSLTHGRRELFVRDAKVLYAKALRLVSDDPKRYAFVRRAGRIVVASTMVTVAYAPVDLSRFQRAAMLCQALWLHPILWVVEKHVWKNSLKLLLGLSVKNEE